MGSGLADLFAEMRAEYSDPARLGRLRRPRPLLPPIFDEEDRKIFRYHNGDAETLEDPLVVERIFLAATAEDDIENIQRQVESTSPSSLEVAMIKLVPAVAAAFGVRPLDRSGRGLSEAAMVGLLGRFLEFVGGVRDEYRLVASFLHAYGWPPPGAFPGLIYDYRFFLGLHWNRRRVESVLAAAVSRGIASAFGRGEPDALALDAMIDDPEAVGPAVGRLRAEMAAAEAEARRAAQGVS